MKNINITCEIETLNMEKVLLVTGLNKIQFEFSCYVMKRLYDEDGSYYARDWLSKPYNEGNAKKISKEDARFVLDKLHRLDFIESDRNGVTYKIGTSGKETIQKHGSFENYVEFEIERIEDEIKKNEKQNIIEELNLRQLRRLTRQAKWWWAIMLLNMILSVAAAYLLFRLGVH
jgi:hypothetical protein